MFLTLERQVRDAVSAHIHERYGVEVPVVVEQPPQPEFGELALPIGFALAKTLKRPPRKIVEEIISELDSIPSVTGLEAAGAGYLNVRFDRGAYADGLLRGGFSRLHLQTGRSSSNIPTSIPTRRRTSATYETPC